MVTFIMMKLSHLDLNTIFDVCVIYLRLFFVSVVCDILIDNETLFDRFHESKDQVGPIFQRCSYEIFVSVVGNVFINSETLFNRLRKSEDQADPVF
jgi:hypothetical protein